MRRTFILSTLIFTLLFAGLAFVRPALILLAIPPFIYMVLGLWNAPEHMNLQIERTLSGERIHTGDEVQVTIKVENRGGDLEELLLEDHIPDGLVLTDGESRHLISLKHGESSTWSYQLQGKRGYYGLKNVTANCRESFDLVGEQQEIATEGQLFILPPVLRLRRVAIQPRRTRIFSGTIPARQGGSGVEFFDLREYQQGDSPRWINWRATARHPQNIFTNEFEQERSADVGLILDGRRRTNFYNGRSIFDFSVLAIASLADAFLSAGNRVGMLYYGKQVSWTMPGYGRIQGERILHDLSKLEPGDSQNFNELYIPRHLFPSRSQLVLVSPLLPEDYDVLIGLRLRGYHLLVISPDPVTFEASGLEKNEMIGLALRIIKMQRSVFLRRVRGSGIQVVDWDTSQPFERMARTELERRAMPIRGLER